MDAPPDIADAGRILVVGAGATGGFFGMRLAQQGRDVTFLVRQARAQALRTRGLHVTGLGRDDVIFPPLVTAQAIETRYDVVLLAVKATALGQAIDDLAPAVGPATVILPFLNGLDHMRVLTERFGPQHVLGGAVKGGTVYGKMPSFVLAGPDDADTRGRWIPTTSIDQYGATLSSWFGVPDSKLTSIFPNFQNFGAQKLAFLG